MNKKLTAKYFQDKFMELIISNLKSPSAIKINKVGGKVSIISGICYYHLSIIFFPLLICLFSVQCFGLNLDLLVMYVILYDKPIKIHFYVLC